MISFLVPENTPYPFCLTTLNKMGYPSKEVRECCSDSCQKKWDYCKKICSNLNCEFKCDELHRICQTGCTQIISPLKNSIQGYKNIDHETKNNHNGDIKPKKKFFIMFLLILLIFSTICLLIVEK